MQKKRPKYTLVRVILFFLSALPILSFAQDTISAMVLLQEELARIDRDVNTQISRTNFQAPWIQKIEFRTETQNFRLKEQQYQLRMTPSNNKIRTAEMQLHELYQLEVRNELAESKARFIQLAYKKILRAYELHRSLEILEKLLQIVQSKEQIINQRIVTGDIDVADWLQTKEQLLEMEQKFEQEQMEYGLLTENRFVLWENFMPIDQIVTEVQEMTASSALTDRNQTKISVAQREIDLEEAERKKYLDFIQLEYNSNPQDLFSERAAVSAAFILPFKGNRKLKMEELAIQQLGLEAEMRIQNLWQTEQINYLKQNISMLYQQWLQSTTDTQNFKAQLELLYERLSQAESSDPLLLLSIQKQILNAALNDLNIEVNIREAYLDLLEESENSMKQ